MAEPEILQFANDGMARKVLTAYCDAIDAKRHASPDFSGWTARLRTIPGVKSEELSRLHGRLIAYGLLRFQLEGGTSGMTYQVSGPGRQLVDRADGWEESEFLDSATSSASRDRFTS